jgi:hypothetical protein
MTALPPESPASSTTRRPGAVQGVVAILLVFAVIGPLLGSFVASGVLGLLAGSWRLAYILGAIPAAATGVFYAVLWLARVGALARYIAAAVAGGLSSAIALVAHGGSALLPLVIPAGIAAALACTWLADYLLAYAGRRANGLRNR